MCTILRHHSIMTECVCVAGFAQRAATAEPVDDSLLDDASDAGAYPPGTLQ